MTIPLDNLARIALERGDYPQAEKLLHRALDIDRASRGTDNLQYGRHVHRLARVKTESGDHEEAEKLFQEAVALYQKLLGGNHPETLDAMSQMGIFIMERGQLVEAERILRQVLSLNRAARGEWPVCRRRGRRRPAAVREPGQHR